MAKSKQSIDFAKYRTPELFETVLNLLDVRGIYANSIFKVFVGSMILGVVGGVLFWTRTESVLLLIPIIGFCLIAGGIAGLFYAIAEVIRQSLDNMLKIVELMLDVTKKIASDMAAIGGGETEMPSAKELVRGVYSEVILPIVEEALGKRLGCLGAPILFLYRMTLGRVMRFVIKIMPEKALELRSGEDIETSKEQIKSGLDKVASNEAQILKTLDWTKDKIVSLGGWFRFLVMIPCYSIFAAIIILIVIALVSIWMMTGNDPEQAEVAFRVAANLMLHDIL